MKTTQQQQKKGGPPPKKILTVPAAAALPPKPAGTTTTSTTKPKKFPPRPPSSAASTTGPKQLSKPQPKEGAAQATSQVKKAVASTKTLVKKRIVKLVKKVPKSVQPPVKLQTKEQNLEQPAPVVHESKKDEEVVHVSNKEEETLVVATVDESKKEEDDVPVSKVEEAPETDVVESAEVEEKEPNQLVQAEMEAADDDAEEPESGLDDMVEDSEEVAHVKDVQAVHDDRTTGDQVEDQKQDEVVKEAGEDEEHAEDDASEPDDEQVEGLEHMEISAIASERKVSKAQEIFVGGLDHDANEDDVRKAFENIGEILEVRMKKNQSTNKNKGYAFVKFADQEQAARALSELKKPLIRGKPCGTAPSEDKHTLFLGNICNTWTKEAIKHKLKDYGVGGVENITLVPDARLEGTSKGFAFLEYSCHADAVSAYKRLQKPDVVFGHAERTAKVAFAEPLRDPDPEVMAQVRSVFVDGLPPYWGEERVREHFKAFGEIEGTMLARNRPSAKRKDFGFVDFTTHEAAVACVVGVNNTELGDDKSKAKVKVRLSNPLPKTQAVKGGIRGGFSIARSRSGKGFGRGERPSNKMHYERGKGDRGGQPQRIAAGRSSQAAVSLRPRHGAPGRGRGQSILPRRQPFLSEDVGQPFGRRHLVDDPYLYNDSVHGIKRPFSMVEEEPGYLEPSRLRSLHHLDHFPSPHELRYEDSVGAGSGYYSHDYYGSDYGRSGYPSTYGRDHSQYGHSAYPSTYRHDHSLRRDYYY